MLSHSEKLHLLCSGVSAHEQYKRKQQPHLDTFCAVFLSYLVPAGKFHWSTATFLSPNPHAESNLVLMIYLWSAAVFSVSLQGSILNLWIKAWLLQGSKSLISVFSPCPIFTHRLLGVTLIVRLCCFCHCIPSLQPIPGWVDSLDILGCQASLAGHNL